MENQISPEIIIPQTKPNYLKTIIFSILYVTLLTTIIFLFFQNQKLQKQIVNLQVALRVESPTPPPRKISSISTTPDETAGWKMYTNSEYYYSVKYPEGWFIYDKGIEMSQGQFVDPKKTVIISPQIIETIPVGDSTVKGGIIINAKTGKVLKETIDKNTFKVEEIVFANKPALKVYAIGELIMGKPMTNLYIGKEYEEFAINFENNDFTGSHEKIFDQILSTFKFTN